MFLFSIIQGVLASAIWQEKEMYPSWKRKSKIVLFANVLSFIY